jgi:hypothetical protein
VLPVSAQEESAAYKVGEVATMCGGDDAQVGEDEGIGDGVKVSKDGSGEVVNVNKARETVLEDEGIGDGVKISEDGSGEFVIVNKAGETGSKSGVTAGEMREVAAMTEKVPGMGERCSSYSSSLSRSRSTSYRRLIAFLCAWRVVR